MSRPDGDYPRTQVPDEAEAVWAEYKEAKRKADAWGRKADELKYRLFGIAGVHPDDKKPQPTEAVTRAGRRLFRIRVVPRRGLDSKYLRESRPDIYAQYERTSYNRYLEAAEAEDEPEEDDA